MLYQRSPREMSSYCPKLGQWMRMTENIHFLSACSREFLYTIKIICEMFYRIQTEETI